MTFNSTLDWQTAKQRALVLQKIRSFFLEKNIIEVETPILSQGTVTDVYLEPLTCSYDFLKKDNHSQQLYLQTSPEFAMKRLLASGFGDIYQICKAFRHEEQGQYHNPEFTILEWYRLGFDHLQLMREVGELLTLILACEKPLKITYQQIFMDHVAVDPLSASSADLLNVLKKHEKLSDWLVNDKDRNVLLQVILSEIIEPHIGNDRPWFIYNFPSSQASLAKISPQDHRVAERFECYFKGVELVNGFHELTNAKTHLERFKQDNLQRKHKGLVEKPIDNNFITALESGLPNCAGVALGIDRLIMLACKANRIEEVISFPINTA